MIFDELTLKGLPRTGKKYVITDESRPGFAVKVNIGGSRGFYYRFKKFNKRREVDLGSDFTNALAIYQACLENTKDVTTAPDKVDVDALFIGDCNFTTLATEWLKAHVDSYLSTHSQKQYRAMLESLFAYLDKHHKPVFHGRSTGREARQAIKAYLLSILDATPILCNRSRSCYSTMFKWGVQRDMVNENPVHDMPVAREKPKQRLLNEDELQVFIPTLQAGQFVESTKDALLLILLTCLRSGEVRAIRPNMIELPAKRLIIPARFTKNERAHLVPLSEPACFILEKRLAEVQGVSERLFKVGVFGLRQTANRACKRADITVCSPHDFRRTAATLLARIGTPEHLIAALLNHKTQNVTNQHYIVYDMEQERRAALDLLGEKLISLGLKLRA